MVAKLASTLKAAIAESIALHVVNSIRLTPQGREDCYSFVAPTSTPWSDGRDLLRLPPKLTEQAKDFRLMPRDWLL